MSTGRRRLESAIQIGKDIDSRLNESDSSASLSKISSIQDIDFGDIGGAFSINFSWDSEYFAVGCGNSAIQVYSVKHGKKRRPLRHGSNFGLPVTCAKFYPFKNNILITTESQGDIVIWDLEEWSQKRKIYEKDNEIETLDFSHDGKIFATAGKDRTVRIYDCSNLEMIKNFPGTNMLDEDTTELTDFGHGRKVFALKFHPFDDNVFITGGWDKCIKVWDVRSAHSVRTIWGPYICGDALDMCVDQILTGSWVADNALQVWDFKSGNLIETIPFPSEKGAFLYCARFLSDELIAAGGSGTKDLKLLYRHTHEIAACLDNDGKTIQALDTADNGHLLAMGSTGNHIRLANLL